MTVVVATEDDTGITLGYDGRCLLDRDLRINQVDIRKVLSVGPWAVGYAGAARFGYLLRSAVDDLATGLESLPPERAVSCLTDRLRRSVREDAYGPVGAGGPEAHDVELIVAHARSGLWYVDCTFAPYRVRRGQFIAIGSGGPSALAAARVLQHLAPRCQVAPARAALLAMTAASAGTVTCGPPFVVGRVGDDGFEELPASELTGWSVIDPEWGPWLQGTGAPAATA